MSLGKQSSSCRASTSLSRRHGSRARPLLVAGRLLDRAGVHHQPDAQVEEDLAEIEERTVSAACGLLVVGCVQPPHIDGVSHSINAEAGALEVPMQLREERGVARSDVQSRSCAKP